MSNRRDFQAQRNIRYASITSHSAFLSAHSTDDQLTGLPARQ